MSFYNFKQTDRKTASKAAVAARQSYHAVATFFGEVLDSYVGDTTWEEAKPTGIAMGKAAYNSVFGYEDEVKSLDRKIEAKKATISAYKEAGEDELVRLAEEGLKDLKERRAYALAMAKEAKKYEARKAS